MSKEAMQVQEASPCYHGKAKEPDVPPGFKKTEAGVIPAEWSVFALREVADIRTGIAKNTKTFISDAILVHYLRVANVQDGFLDLSEMSRLKVSRSDLKRYALQPGDVLMNEGGDLDKLGRGAIWKGQYSPCIHQNHVFVVRCGERMDPEYLSAWSAGSHARRYFLVAGKQTTNLASINKSALGSLPVVVPELAEQRAIAEALSDVDNLTGALDALIAKKRAIKQVAMQQLLTGKTRLPGFRGAWETKRVEQVADCLDNLRVPLNETQRASMPGPYPYCGANGVLDYINDYVLDDDVILTAEDGGYFDEYAHRPIAYRMSGKIWVNNHAHILKAKSGISQGFLFYSLVHKNILPYLARGTRAKLNKSEMYKIEVHIPQDEEEQESLAEILSDMDAEIGALEQRRDKTRAIKQGMMQQLLTGRVRLVTREYKEARA